MIPKIIHYCWLSKNPYPDIVKKCIGSWEIHLKDYKFILWDTERFNINSNLWVKEAFAAKKYAFAADYIRLYALYNYGGIYLDSDVMVYKSFDDLLKLPYFIGQDFVGAFEPAIIGASKETEWLKKVMTYYEKNSFINQDGSFNIRNLPIIFFEQLFHNYYFRSLNDKDEFIDDPSMFNLFTKYFFNGRNNISISKNSKSYCSHLFAGSWTKDEKREKKLFTFIPNQVLNLIYGFNYHFLRKKVVHAYDPIYMQIKQNT